MTIKWLAVVVSTAVTIAAQAPQRLPSSAIFERPHYRNTAIGVEFDLPPGWNYEGTTAWSDNPGETARWTRDDFAGAASHASINVWMAKRVREAPTTPVALETLIANKKRQRQG